MGFEIKTDDEEPIRTRSMAPPPDYSSRAVKFRLMMLFAMLLGVILLMKEAGKPERWRWMGFENQAEVEDATANKSKTPVASNDLQSGKSDEADSREPEPARIAIVSSQASVDYPTIAREFWSNTIQRLSTDQQRLLFRLLRQLRFSGTFSATDADQYTDLVELLRRRRAAFHNEKFDQLTLLTDGSREKTDLANALFESQVVWEKKILPAIEAALDGSEFTVSQLHQLENLQRVLDPLAFREVKDRTSIGWRGDSPAWSRMWEIVAEVNPQNPVAATHLQLSSQPEYYRGNWVRVDGWVRSARQKVASEGESGLNQYHILWVRPADTKLSPYCVFARQLPGDFPELSEQFQDLNERITVAGLFFKVRTYVDATNEVNESPVIIADSFEVIPDFVPTSVSNWQPTRTQLIGFLALIPVLAIAIAWLVYRSSQTQPYHPGAVRTKQIHQALDGLTQNSNVQTDREKIQELYQTDADKT